jgi:5'-3' exonuclease
MLVNILKPNKMIVLGLDGVAPRAKMNNQRQRRFKSSRDYKKYM